MGDTERPAPERLGDQDEQAAHLTRTGNGPTVEDEAALLEAAYGPADMAGHYTGGEAEGAELTGADDEPDAEDGDQAEAAADDTTAGGASA